MREVQDVQDDTFQAPQGRDNKMELVEVTMKYKSAEGLEKCPPSMPTWPQPATLHHHQQQ